MIKIYTDGSYKPTTDQGGYGVVITNNDNIVKILSWGYKHTTNNRQELRGVLEGLKYFKTPQILSIYSDSNYIVNSVNNGFVKQWIQNNDLDKKNLDLWLEIYKLTLFHKVNFIWIKGHNNNQFNELADLYANISSNVINPEIDIKNE